MKPARNLKMAMFENMDAGQLRSYLEFFLHHYRVMDGFWFIYVSERFGLGAAEEINTQVWAKVASLAAREIVDRFAIQERGVRGFLKAYGYFPWSAIIDFQVEEKGNEEAIISVPHCLPQEARLKRGLGEYVCKHMHCAEMQNFAAAVDPRVSVECVFAPPDPHPKELFCQWRIRLKQAPAQAGDPPSA